MVNDNECVKHAVLSVAASYILDFQRHDKLVARANLHQKRAIELLGRALNANDTYSPGNEDAVIATILLLEHNEAVNTGAESESDAAPPWWKATKTAENLLAINDPGYSFHDPYNVQTSRARFEMGNRVGLLSIMAGSVAPTETVEEKCQFPWLQEGTERELRQILGTTGLSARLMHIFAQITHLSARRWKNPDSVVIPAVGHQLEKGLQDFWQWSDLSEGHATSAELMASCVLNEAGFVTTAREMTELIRESYLAAAQVYLQCRLFRKPRYHPDVQEPIERLMKCTLWPLLPGPLYTAQQPLYTVFIGGLVAWTEEQRRVINGFFEKPNTANRSNGFKPWRTVHQVWAWLDAGNGDLAPGYSESSACGWWEDMVAELFRTEGRMDLA